MQTCCNFENIHNQVYPRRFRATLAMFNTRNVVCQPKLENESEAHLSCNFDKPIVQNSTQAGTAVKLNPWVGHINSQLHRFKTIIISIITTYMYTSFFMYCVWSWSPAYLSVVHFLLVWEVNSALAVYHILLTIWIFA